MQIKLKNKKEISVGYHTYNYNECNCRWCGKTIKAGKPHYYSSGGASGDYCSVAHLKAASNAEL